MIVVHEHGQPPDSNPETMLALADLNVLSRSTAEEMARAARFRNVLAHTYGDIIEHDTVYDALHDLDRYRLFLEEIYDYLDEIGAVDR